MPPFVVCPRSLVLLTAFFATSGIVFSILWSFLRNFEESTFTHCKVYNFAPSISSAISLQPQRSFWTVCVLLNFFPRFPMAWFNATHLRERMSATSCKKSLVKVTLNLQYAENVFLLLLTLVNSKRSNAFHVAFFCLFVVCAVAYMCISVYIISHRSYIVPNRFERRSVTLRQSLLKLTLLSSLLMTYFYLRHYIYCEPYVYSYFCICEYVVVLANAAFHAAAGFYLRDMGMVCQVGGGGGDGGGGAWFSMTWIGGPLVDLV